MINKKNIFLLIIFVKFFTLSSLHADEGRLFDQYPPNVAAENFTLSDINGDKYQLEAFRGKFVLINFWAMSCNICKSEMTALQGAYEIINDEKLAIVSIHAGNSYDGVEEILNINKISYTVLFDTALQLAGWGVPILPTTFIVDPQGNIRYRAVGTRVWNSPFMIDFLRNLLDADTTQAATNSL